MLGLEILSSFLLFLNKVYVAKNKAVGWLYGMAGLVVLICYLYLQMTFQHKENLWILLVTETGLVFVMLYGYLVARAIEESKLKIVLKKWNLLFKIIVITLTISICILLLVQAITLKLVVIQFISSVAGLFGTLLLAFNKRMTNIIGWLLYFITHILLVDIFFRTGSFVLAVFQFLSALIAIRAMWKSKKEL